MSFLFSLQLTWSNEERAPTRLVLPGLVLSCPQIATCANPNRKICYKTAIQPPTYLRPWASSNMSRIDARWVDRILIWCSKFFVSLFFLTFLEEWVPEMEESSRCLLRSNDGPWKAKWICCCYIYHKFLSEGLLGSIKGDSYCLLYQQYCYLD